MIEGMDLEDEEELSNGDSENDKTNEHSNVNNIEFCLF